MIFCLKLYVKEHPLLLFSSYIFYKEIFASERVFNPSDATDLFGKLRSGDCRVALWKWTVTLSLATGQLTRNANDGGGEIVRLRSRLVIVHHTQSVNDCGKMSDVYLLAIHSLLMTRCYLSESKPYTSDRLRRSSFLLSKGTVLRCFWYVIVTKYYSRFWENCQCFMCNISLYFHILIYFKSLFPYFIKFFCHIYLTIYSQPVILKG